MVMQNTTQNQNMEKPIVLTVSTRIMQLLITNFEFSLLTLAINHVQSVLHIYLCHLSCDVSSKRCVR